MSYYQEKKKHITNFKDELLSGKNKITPFSRILSDEKYKWNQTSDNPITNNHNKQLDSMNKHNQERKTKNPEFSHLENNSITTISPRDKNTLKTPGRT